jgi:hypothetical protein
MDAKEQSAKQAESENSLVKLYTEITGTSDLCARGVLIHLDTADETQKGGVEAPAKKEPEQKP